MDLQDKARMRLDVERTALAISCFRAETGRWPGELAELTPSLLKAVPMDAFSQGPLVYRADEDGCIVYSVGINLTDDGGECGDGYDAEDDDIAAKFANP
ncbi:unnamed protein product [marine sediment metagenome]|uniref:Type II secretion system protein GspG C-terminal domain-containing protein n=1 Tax=marine sediment metagenome TaxID=412755 RepID=X0ZG22_9ZZZZ